MLVVTGENRLSGQSRDQTIRTLAQVGEPDHEVPDGPAEVIVARPRSLPARPGRPVITGPGQAHTHQHVSMAAEPLSLDASQAAGRTLE